MEITAGPPEVRVPAGTEATDTVSTAESVLAKRVGACVRLADPEDLGGSDRSVVLRVRVAETPFDMPRTLVLKHYGTRPGTESSDPFAHEAASLQLVTALTPEDRLGPELIAQSADERLLVLEDLGRGFTLADVLFGEDSRAAEQALLSWARALGRVHKTMAGREPDFDALMRRLGAKSWVDPIGEDAKRAVPDVPELLEHVLDVTTPEEVVSAAHDAAALLASSRYRSFSPSDICPDNSLVTGNGVRFLDFEWGCMRDVAMDAAFLQVPFPSSWCSYSIPAGISEAMLSTWRSEVCGAWPELDDDDVLMPRLFDAKLLWVWLSTWWFLPRPGQPDTPVDAHMPSPRRSTALVDRWSRLGAEAEAAGREAIADHATRVADALIARHGSDAAELRCYPAFRS